MRVTDAAERLGVSVSTAHRLLAMLVYRDFAEQQEDRRYRAGPVLAGRDAARGAGGPAACGGAAAPAPAGRRPGGVGRTSACWRGRTCGSSRPSSATTCCGSATAPGAPCRCTSRRAARRSSRRCRPTSATPSSRAIDDVDLPRLTRELALVRRRGYALNDQATETGLTAVGVAVPDVLPGLHAALSLAVPTVRWSRELVAGVVPGVERGGRAISHGSRFGLIRIEWLTERGVLRQRATSRGRAVPGGRPGSSGPRSRRGTAGSRSTGAWCSIRSRRRTARRSRGRPG